MIIPSSPLYTLLTNISIFNGYLYDDIDFSNRLICIYSIVLRYFNEYIYIYITMTYIWSTSWVRGRLLVQEIFSKNQKDFVILI